MLFTVGKAESEEGAMALGMLGCCWQPHPPLYEELTCEDTVP